ncbi:UBX domain-containing protein 10 [Entelurus aequoreus]|uniref:UBX domain-containing protein 10 n=1 Tax=Entelurus aequoreus TaxID=161455 RepID=UPI002B1D94F7|nr:UBX domain-containing protein 10 [Entelurus aequoreus]
MDLSRPESKTGSSLDPGTARVPPASAKTTADLQGSCPPPHAPDLNKYKVLPAIPRGRSGTRSPPPQEEVRAESWCDGGTLLLAVSAPCGGSFEQHFEPSDPLRVVRDSAEVRFGTRYGEVSIATMDVPRRSFRDLERTLVQCGVHDRSVLCIFLSQQ